jgi:hypothetical protein
MSEQCVQWCSSQSKYFTIKSKTNTEASSYIQKNEPVQSDWLSAWIEPNLLLVGAAISGLLIDYLFKARYKIALCLFTRGLSPVPALLRPP